MKHNEEIEVETVAENEEVTEVEETEAKDAEVEDTVDTDEEMHAEETELTQLKKQLQEEENKYFRVLADYDNFKRRSTQEKEAIQKYQSQRVLTSILPVLDNFERALSVEAKTDEAKSMMEGMDMIYRSLVDTLKSEGLIEIESLDKEFDPNFHQAVMTDKDEEKPSGVVLEEMQKGYILKDRVLRPAMVKVNE
ncbi:nucleotide exchange factor GrpE [Sporosarcina pasteurii]|uniref:Protein GrpE n=1 Tax=Sporosarcina pasteurii TaxID=1474 RepID=A0A380BN44_SPOPA|nr:nucleotide exchange factor GrpE [Sporosarcina pasteurii]MDS9471013.1 nucleotide exchange factor GrpE [Sporosarcina pasteurii]QBQ05338.1 nucleotide exchange factor GrpE [Sporosarcina pasteurii]SUJ03955.1 HSP-70 cofactor [Sporosarcina pasteurii]